MSLETQTTDLRGRDSEASAASDPVTDVTSGVPEASTSPETPALGRRERVRAALPLAGSIVLLTLGIKLLIYSYGVVVNQTAGRNFTSFAERMSIWSQWDASNYLSLAENGYQTVGRAANYIVFFPGYPFLVRAFNWVVPGDVFTAALVVSGIASVAAALLLGFLVRHDTGGDDAQALRSVWFFLIFPTAYFLHVPYTESLFIALVVGAFLAARTGRWATAGVIGALAALTRLNGAILIPALAVEAYLQYRKTGRFDRRYLWIGFIATGTLVYLWINQHVWGDPLHFQDVQKEVWFKSFQDPYHSVKGMVGSIAGNETQGGRQMNGIQELLFLAIGLVAAVAAWFWTRPSYAVWVFLNVMLFASTSWIQSTPRYALTLFPIFLLLGKLKSNSVFTLLLTAWSLLMLAWFTHEYVIAHWAF